MTLTFPTLIISRQPRHLGGSWDNARSWFGGKPRLGRQPWPRNALKTPFYFVAQIDLDEVAKEIGSQVQLPDGALAFFIGTDSNGMSTGAVVYVPRSELGEPTEPPPDAPAVLNAAGSLFPEFPSTFNSDTPRLFPFWPVNITTLNVETSAPPDADDEDGYEATEALLKAQIAAVDRHFTRREFFLTANEAFKVLGDAPRPCWWHTAHHYAACLRTDLVDAMPHILDFHRRALDRARTQSANLRPTGLLSALGLRSAKRTPEVQKAEDEVSRCETVLADLRRLVPEFERFVQDVGDWVRGKDPWEFMPREAVEEFKSTFERGKKAFSKFRRYTPQFFDQLETETLLALTTADDRAYATMPEALRTLINTKYLLPSEYWHQMFGWGVDIQGAVWDYADHVLLLQLVYDDMMHWDFGDIGAYQFWITPNDLLLGNWDAVKVTFECH